MTLQIENEKTHKRVPSDRAVGALLGAAVGDALGWPQEKPKRTIGVQGQRKAQIPFQSWKRRAGSRFHAYEETIQAGEYSDDTQLILATARSLLRGSTWSTYLVRQELPVWLLYQRGGGGSILQSARSWAVGTPPWRAEPKISNRYFASGANGAAMRVIPHALISCESIDEMHKKVMINSIFTHGHPRAILGSLLYTQAARFMASLQNTLAFGGLVDYLLDTRQEWSKMRQWEHKYEPWIDAAQKHSNGDYKSLWQNTVHELVDSLQLCHKAIGKSPLVSTRDFLVELGALDQRTSGAGTVTAIAAVYFASVYASDPVTGLLEAAFAYGSDTDTIASMTGALLGALLGTEWIRSEWSDLQDIKYLSNLAQCLATADLMKGRPESSSLPQWHTRDNKRFLDQLVKADSRAMLPLGSLGNVKVLNAFHNRPLTRRWTHRCWKLESLEGQTVYVAKMVQRESAVSKESVKPSSESGEKASLKSSKLSTSALLRGLANVVPPSLPVTKSFRLAADVASILEGDKEQIEHDIFLSRLETDNYHRAVANRIRGMGYDVTNDQISHMVLVIGMSIAGA